MIMIDQRLCLKRYQQLVKPQVTGIGVQVGWSAACRPPAGLGWRRCFLRRWLLPVLSVGHGSGPLGADTGPVPDGGHRLLLAERGPGGERLTEPVVPQRL